MKKILKVLYNFILAILFIFLLAFAGTFFPFEKFLGGKLSGYKIFTVQSGSMAPKINVGSLIFVKSAADYNVDDVITIRSGKNTFTHRIVEKLNERGEIIYKTKGDANEEADPEPTSAQNIVGKVFLTLPYVGYSVGYARTRAGFILLVIVPSTIIVYEELYSIKQEISQKLAARKKRKENEKNIEKKIRIIDEEPKVLLNQSKPSPVEKKTPPRRKII